MRRHAQKKEEIIMKCKSALQAIILCILFSGCSFMPWIVEDVEEVIIEDAIKIHDMNSVRPKTDVQSVNEIN